MKKVEFPKVLTIADLTTRWQMSRQGIHDRTGDKDFPKPIQYVANGRTALFLEKDIEQYEIDHPWIMDPDKRRKRQLYIWSLMQNS